MKVVFTKVVFTKVVLTTAKLRGSYSRRSYLEGHTHEGNTHVGRTHEGCHTKFVHHMRKIKQMIKNLTPLLWLNSGLSSGMGKNPDPA